MSDKDDLFTPDEEFGDLENDDFFAEPEETKAEEAKEEDKPAKKVKVPDSIPEAKADDSSEESEAEEVEEPEPEEKAEEPEPEEKVEEPEKELEKELEKEPEKTKTESPKPTKSKSKSKDGLNKRASRPLTLQEKEVNKILRRALMDSPDDIIPVDELTKDNRKATRMKISDIAVFIGKPENEILAKLFEKMPNLNRVNLSAEVDLNRARTVGGEMLHAGRMYQPIQVAEIEEDGAVECTSGRHRLVALAILFGADAQVEVQIEKMDLATARDAVVVANMARKAKAMEKAEHAALSAVGGDIDIGQDELYSSMVRNKGTSRKYCTYTVMERGRPAKLVFKVGDRKKGGVASVSAIEGFWAASINWHKGITRKEFDKELKGSTLFLNSLVKALQANPSFEPKDHAKNKLLAGVGKYYRTMVDAGVSVDDAFVDKLSNMIVAIPKNVDSNSIEAYYSLIVGAMK